MNTEQQYKQVSLKTAADLRTVALSSKLQALSMLSLPEVDAAVDVISRVLPAGNVPSMILSGLARLPGNRAKPETVKRDINLLLKGVSSALDKATYAAFFAGPAAVIWGYQNLLKLAGKSPEESFPEGLWQFYAEYALREDTARFTVETHGFDSVLQHHHIDLSSVNRITAWVMASIQSLHQFNDLLANEWRERVYVDILQTMLKGSNDGRLQRLVKGWERKRPYGRQQDAEPNEPYAHYRHRKFDRHFDLLISQFDSRMKREWYQRVSVAKRDLPSYQHQMSILAYLEPTAYGEVRRPIPLQEAHIALVYQGRYYLIPVCQPGKISAPTIETVQAQVHAILQQPVGSSAPLLSSVAATQRKAWASLRDGLNPTVTASLDLLRSAPIVLNMDARSSALPLAEIRQGERGVGDHALTIFDTQKTFVFDLSHIFFDGAWSAAFTEIVTQEALAWGVYLQGVSNPQAAEGVPSPVLLSLPFEQRERQAIQQAAKVTTEVCVETTAIRLKPVLDLRKMFKMRNDLLTLTVNDLLVLYRAIHATTYKLEPKLAKILELMELEGLTDPAVLQNLTSGPAAHKNPAILIPIDATRKDPKDRIYPLILEVPVEELDLISLHSQTLALLDKKDDPNHAEEFTQLQNRYLATLAGFGKLLTKVKDIAADGDGMSHGAMKLLAHMPVPLQRLLDHIPSRFEVLNDLIKGREVYSNLGRVAPGSSLNRFCTAKDDNEQKTLAWGILTDMNGVVHLSLRDFRPHIPVLTAGGHYHLANEISQDYLDSYVKGFNRYIKELSHIVFASSDAKV